MPFLRSLPVDSPAVGPHQTFHSGPRGGGGVGGPHLDRTAAGRHQQWRQLRSHQGLRPEQAGQRPVRTLPGQALTGWGGVAERVQGGGAAERGVKKITARHILNLSHAGESCDARWSEACQRAEDIVEVGGGNKEPVSLFLKGAESVAAPRSALHKSLT